MSQYEELTTTMTDQQYLVEARVRVSEVTISGFSFFVS